MRQRAAGASDLVAATTGPARDDGFLARAHGRGAAVPVDRSAERPRSSPRPPEAERGGGAGRARARSPSSTPRAARDQAARAGRRLDARERPRQPRTPPGGCSAARAPRTLTPAQAETLAIVAYLQPISRPEITRIRGVSADSADATLLERGLIEEAGHSQFGAVLYRTSTQFLKLFGLRTLEELPDVARWDPTPRGAGRAARAPARAASAGRPG